MKKDYEKPAVEVIDFQSKDIVASDADGFPGMDESVADDF